MVVEFARASLPFLFDLGYFKLVAFATITLAHAYFLSRLNHQATRREVVEGRQHALDLATELTRAPHPFVEKVSCSELTSRCQPA